MAKSVNGAPRYDSTKRTLISLCMFHPRQACRCPVSASPCLAVCLWQKVPMQSAALLASADQSWQQKHHDPHGSSAGIVDHRQLYHHCRAFRRRASISVGVCTQYHEIIRELVGKWMSIFTLIVCILAALGSCLPQIVASSANIYRINSSLNKRCELSALFTGSAGSPMISSTLHSMRLVPIKGAIFHHHSICEAF